MDSEGASTSTTSHELKLKVKTLQPATYEVTASAEVRIQDQSHDPNFMVRKFAKASKGRIIRLLDLYG